MSNGAIRYSTWKRRSVSVSAVVVALVVLVPSLLVLVPVAAIYDLARRRNLPTVRMLLLGVCYLAWEVVAITASAVLWLATGFGRFAGTGWSLRAHRRLQARWVNSILRLAATLLHLRLEVVGADLLAPGPIVVLCRHASMVDTLIPAKLLFDAGLDVRYVLKTELAWDPALDIIGHRLPNHFVDRSGSNTAAEVDSLERLARGAGASDAVVIFPEGTRWTPAKHERAVARLIETDPALGARAALRRFTMPPRPAGTLAVLEGAPDADVLILSYTGLEGLAGPADALRLVPFSHPVKVNLRRLPRSQIPATVSERVEWLNDQWATVDTWIAENYAP